MNVLNDDHINSIVHRCSNIKSLDLRWNKRITDLSIARIIRHYSFSLEELDVSDTEIFNSTLCDLKSMQRLKILNANREDKGEYEILKSHMPNLKIDESDCLKIAAPNKIFPYPSEGFWEIQSKRVQLKPEQSMENKERSSKDTGTHGGH